MFDHTRHGLFAFGEQSVVTYNLGQEKDFFAGLLRSSEAAAVEPFYRFSLAKEARLPDLIVKAFEECVRQLRSDSPEFAEEWIRKNRIDVRENRPSLIGPEIASWTSTTAKVPSVFSQRGQPYPFAMLRQQDEF
jgi:hypothetical protein